ncbi:MAG TPA: hypothetical protein VGS57_23110 [Thermoanaerobaculia bacterium]|nr:hypothetical protein [Thermoanaerobaculia bacterium]
MKATDTGRLRHQVSLTNLQKLITHPLPAFFLILDFGGADCPQAAYLVPLAEEMTDRVLRRIRRLDVQGKDLRNRKLSVTGATQTRLELPAGSALVRAIRNHIGCSLEEYVKRKLALVETIGYGPDGPNTKSLTLKFSEESLKGVALPEYLVDLTLGLRDSLSVLGAEVSDNRFDIPCVLKTLPAGELTLNPETTGSAEVVFRLGSSAARITMDMILPGGLGHAIDINFLKARFRSQCLDLVVGRSQMTVRLDTAPADANLRGLHEWAQVVLLFAEALKFKLPVECVIYSSGRVLFENALAMQEMDLPPEVVTVGEVIRDAWLVAERLGIQDQVRVSIGLLMRQKTRLRLFLELLDPTPREVRVGGSFEPEPIEGSGVCVPFGTEVLLGDYKGIAVVSVWGKATYTGKDREGRREFGVASTERRTERVFATRLDENNAASLAIAVNAIADGYDDDVQCWLLPQYVI